MGNLSDLNFYEPRQEPEENECDHDNLEGDDNETIICPSCKEHASPVHCSICDKSFGSDCCGV